MDSLKTLMDRKEYDLVLKITENATDPNDLFYRISALIAMGRYDDALSCIETNRQILQKDLLLLMHVHIEILCILNRFDEAYEAMRYYQELPYESQKVEEYLKELPNLIRMEEKKALSVNVLNEEDLIKKLKSLDQNDVLMALDSVRGRDITPYLPAISRIMVDFPHQSVRSFALMLLVQKQVDKELKFKSIDDIITVNPAKEEPPFVGKEFNEFTTELSKELKNPSLTENAIQILSTYIIYTYPRKNEIKTDLYIAALYLIANEYLQSKDSKDLSQIALEYDLDEDELTILVSRMKEALDNF